MEFDPDAFLAAHSAAPTPDTNADPVSAGTPGEGFDPDAFLHQINQDKYGGIGQQAVAGLEGAARGVAGPLATLAEKHLLKVPEEDILGREEANPITAGIGQAAGLTGSLLTGVGEGALLAKAGSLAADAAGLAGPVSLAARVGSEAVKQAAEMAILQGGDETSKMILHDPHTSAQSAIANVGMASALGAGGGALFAGVVNPLWSATKSGPIGQFVGKWVDHLNGGKAVLPEAMDKAAATLGIDVGPEIRGANQSAELTEKYNALKYSQKPEIKAAEAALHQNMSESVMQSTGKSVEELQNYDVARAGRDGMETFKAEHKAIAEPITKEFNELTEPFRATKTTDNDIAELSDKVVQMANEKKYLGQDIPQQKVVDSVLTRLPGLKTADDVKGLITTINNIVKENPGALSQVGRDMKGLVLDTQQNILGRAIKTEAPNLFDRYVNARKAYASLARTSDRAGAELGIGKFDGPEGFLRKLEEKRSPEEFLRRLSPDHNAEILPFLQEHFPKTLEYVKDNELKKIIAPAVKAAKGDHPINVKTLQEAIASRMAGQAELTKFVLPQELIAKAEAAETLRAAIPAIKDSGTPGGVEKMIRHSASSALGGVAMLTGHNPLMGAVVGHVGQLLRRDAPDAVNLAMLRILGSDQPIKAEALKGAVDFLHNTIKGENMLAKSTAAVFKSGVQVIEDKSMPNKAQNEKLDKIVDQSLKTPDVLMKLTQGPTGHYFPEHQTALTQTATQTIQYLQHLKPQPYRSSPLDREVPPSEADTARYTRALSIANQPSLVLQHVKDGTVQANDLIDLKSMYPSLYQNMSQKLSNEMTSAVQAGTHIPYKTRLGLSLFLGQPLDSTMTPSSIMAAQIHQQQKPAQPPQGQQKGDSKALGKSNSQYMTPEQSSESHKADKK